MLFLKDLPPDHVTTRCEGPILFDCSKNWTYFRNV